MSTSIKITNIPHKKIKFNVWFQNLKITQRYGVKQP